MDDRERNLAIGAAGSTIGGYAIYRSIKDAVQKTAVHFNNDLRNQVADACGEQVSMNQWHDLIRSDTWLRNRPSLPNLGLWGIMKKLAGPSTMYYVGAAVAGFSLDLFIISILSEYPEDIRDPGINLTIGLTFVLGWLGRFWLFKEIRSGFVKADSLYPGHPICEEVRRMNLASAAQSMNSLSSAQTEEINELIILQSSHPSSVHSTTATTVPAHIFAISPSRIGGFSNGQITIMGAVRTCNFRMRFSPLAYQAAFK